MQSRTDTQKQLIAKLLDKGYTQAAGQVVDALTRGASSGLLAQRVSELEAEAARLAEAGDVLRPDNPVLRAVAADLRDVLERNRALIDGAGPRLTESGVQAAATLARQLTLGGTTDAQLAAIGIQWNTPNPEAVAALVDYVNQPAWASKLDEYVSGTLGDINAIAIRGVAQGAGPLKTARLLRAAAENMPVWRAQTMMRTLQLHSYRRSTTATYLANADILEGRIRIATLDGRVCMACIALHGTRLRLDEEVIDHDNGRCDSIGELKGMPRTVVTGEQWFESQPEARQRAQMGHAAYEAWRAGDVRLQDFVHRYEDDLWGPMVREASLKGMLGDAAKGYYQPGRRGEHRTPQQIAMSYGMVSPDKGQPGDSEESLNAFLATSDGPVARAIKAAGEWENPYPALDLDWDSNQYRVNRDNVYQQIKAFVSEGRDTSYGGDYLVSLIQERAAENGVTVSAARALYNREYAAQANALLALGRIGKVKLTDAQQRWLTGAASGNYYEMSTATERAADRRAYLEIKSAGNSNMTPAARAERRRNFLIMLNDLDRPKG
jgi:hypothetical protein